MIRPAKTMTLPMRRHAVDHALAWPVALVVGLVDPRRAGRRCSPCSARTGSRTASPAGTRRSGCRSRRRSGSRRCPPGTRPRRRRRRRATDSRLKTRRDERDPERAEHHRSAAAPRGRSRRAMNSGRRAATLSEKSSNAGGVAADVDLQRRAGGRGRDDVVAQAGRAGAEVLASCGAVVGMAKIVAISPSSLDRRRRRPRPCRACRRPPSGAWSSCGLGRRRALRRVDGEQERAVRARRRTPAVSWS